MSEKVAQAEQDDEPLALVDQAIDMMIVSLNVIDENLSKVKPANVPEQAALDEVKSLMDEAVKPYLADAVQVMQIFGE